jgi:hypothetical protein
MTDSEEIPNIDNIELELIPYKTNNKSQIQKFHIVRKNGHTVKHRICNVYAPFGRQTSTDHKTKNQLEQHRLNVCFSKSQIESNSDKAYLELKRLITELETYFGSFDDLSDYNLLSNIINRSEYGIVIRFHLKTNKNKTVTPLIQITSDEINENKQTKSTESTETTEWISFNKTKQFNFNFHPDSLWIDHKNKKYGVSLMIDKVFQLI